MTLFEAKLPDPIEEARVRRRKAALIMAMVVLILLGTVAYWNRFWPEERAVDGFFAAVEQKDYNKAYAIWRADPQWEQHTERYKAYPFGQFQLDWGPTGNYGNITKHAIVGTVSPSSNNTVASGVVVAVRVNGLNDSSKLACLWVEKSTKTISYSPRDCATP